MGVTLICTKGVAARRYGIAIGAAALPSIMRAWATGRIDERKVAVITEGLRDVDEVFADSLAAAATEYAARRTATELRAWLGRRVITADPGAAEIRRSRATADRRISLTPLPDGVSELTALLPSIQARQIYDTANAIAHDAGADDLRTMDQRRADALFDLLVGRADPPQVHVQVMVPVDTLIDAGAEPGVVPGIGPVTAAEARDLAAGGCGSAITWRRLLTDATSGALLDVAEAQYRPSPRLERAVRARDVTCRFPGCRRSAVGARTGTDLDHTVAWPEGATQATNLAALCRHHHRLKHSPGWKVECRTDGVLKWTTPVGRTFTTEPWAYTEAVADPAPFVSGSDPPAT
ncbi:MAG: HNH endonuclease [Actinomycetia bacterium]|nr:HNH endonuclease [Actinomycetes bacterium]